MSHTIWSRCASVWEYLFFCVWRMDELLCMIHLSSLFSMDVDYLSLLFFFLTCLVGMWHTFLGYASLFFFLTCLLSMWHTFFGYASFISSSSSLFFIAHILDSHFREKESWYVMEFYFVGGWQCLLCEWMCTWSWSRNYDKSLTMVKEFDKTQSKVKLHMKVWVWKSNFDFSRNFH